MKAIIGRKKGKGGGSFKTFCFLGTLRAKGGFDQAPIIVDVVRRR